MIVDAHTHVFPPEVASNRSAFREDDHWFGELYASPRVAIATANDLLSAMETAGVHTAIVASFGWQSAATGRFCADYVLDKARESKGRLAPLAYVQPSEGGEGVRRLSADLARGFVGVGELMPAGQRFDLDDHDLLRPFLHLAAEAGAPVLVHVSEPVGHLYPGKGEVSVRSMWRLATSFPRVRFVAAHWGGGLPFYELMPEVRAGLTNVWYDTAATSYLYDPRVFTIAVQLVGADRILFASDYPVLTYRRLLRSVERLDLEPDARAQIMGRNAAELFGIPLSSGTPRGGSKM